MERFICLHGHFYQPPRENPWLEHVETQDSAFPYHDWNERITAECYAPNANCRILDVGGKIIQIVNNYSRISFNFGPTLLSWIRQKHPDLYFAIQEADRMGMKRFNGHGCALAQVYNHIIMPLANRRDKETQVVWGIQDFIHHFGRNPEGMWLAQMAVDIETLELLAEHGIRFTILSPGQARRTRKIGEENWTNVEGEKIDPHMPYRCSLPSGRKIVLFFYDGLVAREMNAGLLSNGERLAKRLCSTFSDTSQPQLAHVAMDGETYGYHHRLADMTLAYCLYYLESQRLATPTVYGEYLEKYPPVCEVEILENSSWSCLHGIERWRSDCGCNSGSHPGWNQAWRGPLRGALDWLRDTLQFLYEEGAKGYFDDPWKARNDYIELILSRTSEAVEAFLSRHALKTISEEEKVRMLKLLEMQRNAMLMYTSCGWFFDEISGVETVQIMEYAARAMQFAHEVMQMPLEDAFLKILEMAPSNLSYFDNGAQVYKTLVKPAVVDLLRVGAHYAISSLFENYEKNESLNVYSYIVTQKSYERMVSGKHTLAMGMAGIRSEMTREEKMIGFAVLHLGDHNLSGGVRYCNGADIFSAMLQEIKQAFERGDVHGVLRLMDSHFGMHNYSFWHLFRDDQRKILNQVFENTLSVMDTSLRQIYETHAPMTQAFHTLRMPFPKVLKSITEFLFNADLRKLLDTDPLDIERTRKLIDDFAQHSVEFDKNGLELLASEKIVYWMQRLEENPEDASLLKKIVSFFALLQPLSLQLKLWKAQNLYFCINKKMEERGLAKTEADWIKHFRKLGNYLSTRSLL